MTGKNLLTAFRYFRKNLGFTTINGLGLSVGLAACMLIVLYITDELRYDRYNTNAENIYRITQHVRLNGHEDKYAGTEKPLLDALEAIPEIRKSTRLVPVSSLFLSPRKYFVRKDGQKIEENSIVFAESGLFDLFTLPVVHGDHSRSLADPFTAVITESAAKKYFNRVNVVGQQLVINDSSIYQVTAVIEDVPEQSHFNYDIFLSYASTPESKQTGWGYSGIHNYLLVAPGTDIAKLEQKIRAIELEHFPASITEGGNFLNIILMPLLDIHLRSYAKLELQKGGDIRYVYIFSIITLFILLIAGINFMNLSTARSANRSREVGVRKVLGSGRMAIIKQFLTESVLLAFIAGLLAVCIAWLVLPFFNDIAGKSIGTTNVSLKIIIPALLGVAVLVGLLSGLYPAFYLSGFKPVSVLKGKFSTGFNRSYLRSGLVVFQFSVSIFLIIGSLIINRQLKYIHSKDLGFNRSQVLVINNMNTSGIQSFSHELAAMQGITDVTISDYLPTGNARNITGFFPQLPIDVKQVVLGEFWPVDEKYLQTLDIELVAGRNFSPGMSTDAEAIIVNESFVRNFGLKQPLNQTFYRNSMGIQQYHIIGVMKDFNFTSLKNEVTPVALSFGTSASTVSARVNTTDLSGLLAGIEAKYKEFSPGAAFEYSFMDNDFDAIYRSEEKLQQITLMFSILAIFIACMGLFGLAAYAAEQRNKEIAIRKVIGASVAGICRMLSLEFLKLVMIAALIGIPVGLWVMHQWLEEFAYREPVGWLPPSLTLLLAIGIALFTIIFQALRAALGNPVKTLKSE